MRRFQHTARRKASKLFGNAPTLPEVGTTLASRIREVLEETGLGKAEVARRLGISPSAVTQWLQGHSKKLQAANALQLEVITGYRAEWLSEGRLPKKASDLERLVSSGLRTYPVIKWEKAGAFHASATYTHGMLLEEAKPAVRDAGHDGFYLRVRGESMVGPPGGKTYPEGCLILIDPSKTEPRSGQAVIAQVGGAPEPTFKIFMYEDGRRWLRPLNPMHPLVTDEFRIIGSVIGKWEDS